MKIVFIGTPDFAVESLKAMVEADFGVVAVITAPDKPAGRGMHLQQSPVKKYALEKNIPILQPTNLKDEKFIEVLKNFGADLQVVIAFRMLPEKIWNMPRLGTINLHASLLPDYRGAAPINRVIMNGEKETGLTTFFLKHEIDTGDIILQKKISLSNEMNAGQLHDLLKTEGAKLMVETLKQIENNSYKITPQKEKSLKIAPKIFTEDCKISWTDNGNIIANQIRGLSPYPGCFSELNGKVLKIFSADFIVADSKEYFPGKHISDGKTYLHFVCNDGFINVTDIQLEGKKRMPVTEFLKGHRIEN